MSDSICGICDKVILNSHSFLELKCNVHLAHGEHGTLDCPICVQAPLPPQAVSSPAAINNNIADAAAIQRRARMKERSFEPLEPVYQQEHGRVKAFVGGMLTSISKIISNGKPPFESNDPFVLLEARAPLKEVVVDTHGIGITEMINDWGVTINTFFDNGYTLGDMCDAFGDRMNDQEGIDVLCALGMHQDHFRRLPEYAQVGIAQSRLGYVPMDMVKRFGYVYRSPLSEDGWTLPELASVGITFPVAVQGGLQHQAQWEELKQTATDQRQIIQFGATAEKVNSLLPPLYNQQQQQQHVQEQYTPVGGGAALYATPSSSSNAAPVPRATLRGFHRCPQPPPSAISQHKGNAPRLVPRKKKVPMMLVPVAGYE